MKGMSEEEAMGYLQDTLFVIGGKWKMPILRAMHYGNFRFREIQRAVPNITTKVLSNELKNLEENKLITRTVYENPLLVEYKISNYTNSLIPILEQLVLWGSAHRKKIKEE